MRRPDPILVGCMMLFSSCAALGAEPERSKNGLFPDEVISAEDLKKEMEMEKDPAVLVLDARDKKTFNGGHIRGARQPRSAEYYRQEELFRTGLAPSIPDPDKALEEGMKSIPKNTPIATYCNSNCHMSAALALNLKKLGFTNVRSMEEGFQEWEKKGYPVERQTSAV